MLLRIVRALGWLVLALLLLALAAVLYLRSASSPALSGTLTLPGLKGSVSVMRDRWGIPHIRAQASDEDAVYALGFVHAQDRLWQMEFQRRIAQGRLSEVLGKAAFLQDKFLRTWGFYRAARASLPALSARTRTLISAYTAGMNAAIRLKKYPLEFTVLGFQPEPWTDVDSVAWAKLLAYDLGGNWQDEVTGQRAVQQLGAAGLDMVLPPYPSGAPTILQAEELKQPGAGQTPPLAPVTADLPAGVLTQLHAQLQAAASLGFVNAPGKGSNDWVIGGQRTASGKPILADDPHLSLSAPMLWYLADVQGPTLHAIGASIPGLPGIVIGRNERIAWGVTNVNPDVQDLYVEGPDARLTSRTEVIKIKGEADKTITVRESGHGPVVADSSDWGDGQSRAVSLEWTALKDGDTTFDAFLGLNYAQNWTEFVQALSKYVAPSQNFVYADTRGNIGYYAPGRVPVRSPGWDGSLPVPDDSAHTWTGYIPFAELPHAYNPPDGLVVTANNKPVPASYPHFLANERMWAEPYRAERILQRLDVQKPLTLDDVARTQLDTVSLVWQALKPFLLATQPADELSRKALELLRGWDGKETLSSVQASIFEAWHMKLQAMVQDQIPYTGFLDSLAVLNQLKADGPLCREGGTGNCAALLRQTLQKATAELSKKLGADPNAWQWGRIHHSLSAHGAFGGVGAISWLWNRGVPTPGGTDTVNVARPNPVTFNQTHAPSYRQIIDLSDMDNSRFIGTLGQGGNPLGAHYDDMQALWRDGQYLPMSTRAADWGDTRTLTLRPKP